MGLTDLFRPKWKHSDSSVRRAAVKELDDQAALAYVAKNDKEQARDQSGGTEEPKHRRWLVRAGRSRTKVPLVVSKAPALCHGNKR